MDRGNNVVELRNVAIYHSDDSSRGGVGAEGELVLSDVNLSVAAGETVYFIGRVGSGKSTLLKTMYAEIPLHEGEGRVVGMDLRRLRRSAIPYLRRRMGIVFQDYQLLDDRNVFFNLYDVMKATGWRREADIRRRIDEVLTLVGLDNKAYKQNPDSFEGNVAKACEHIRIALTGRKDAPDLFTLITILGKDEVVKRLKDSIK